MKPAALAALLPAALALAAIAPPAPAQEYPAGFGPNPDLPAPVYALIPTLHVAPAQPWPPGTHPTPAAGLAATAYGTGLDHPRWLYVLPNGDVLVAESNKPDNGPKETGIRATFQRVFQKKAGAGVPSPNRIILLRGIGAQGAAATQTLFMQGLNSPFGMALVGNWLYLANADALWRFPYRSGDTSIAAQGEKVLDLPSGINHHWTKNVVASADGRKLYITVGSNSNVAENGAETEAGRAAIYEYDLASGSARVYASGLRNPNGLAFQPQTGALWTAVNERDELGNELVPDYMTAVKDGAFYGWPYSYYGQHVDTRAKPQRPDLVARAIRPDYALGAHTASLGLAFYDADLMPQFKNGALIGQHGSWNRRPFAGYKLIFVPFANGQPSGPPQDVLTGFLGPDGQAYGRPVGVALDKAGAILLADDVGNVVWRITPADKQAALSQTLH